MLDHFVHECPVCGRPLCISTVYAGHEVACCHCRGRFVAAAPTMNGDPLTAQENSLLRRANHLLEIANRRLGAMGAPNASTVRPAYRCDQFVYSRRLPLSRTQTK